MNLFAKIANSLDDITHSQSATELIINQCNANIEMEENENV